MTIEKVDLSQERQIIIMMIVSTEFLNQIIPVLKIRYLKSSYAKTVAKWIIEYYNEFKEAPGKNIQSIYQTKLSSLRNEQDTELIAEFLSRLSKDWEKESLTHNIHFFIKNSIKYLKLSSLEILKNEIENSIIQGDSTTAEQKIAEYNRVEKPNGSGFYILRDYESIAKAFTDKDEIIFRFPGILGDVCNNFLRGDLVSFLAAKKVGKCLTGDSLIQLADGSIRNIKDLVEKREKAEVISLNESTLQFEKDQVEDFIICGKHPVYEIELRTGRKIICAITHPFLTFNGWKKLKDLKIGDKIVVGKNVNVFGDLEMPEYKIRLLAYLLADGGLTGSDITFAKKESKIMNDFIRSVRSIGDYITWIDEGHVRIRKKNCKSNKKTQTRLFFESIGIDRCKSIHKKIPDCIFLLSKNFCSLFLSILFTCDGSVFSNKEKVKKIGIEYSSGSKIMINQIQLLLTRFNIISIIKPKKVKGKYYYNLYIGDKENVLRFFNEIGFLFSKKKKMENYLKQLKINDNSYGNILTNFPKEMKEKIMSISKGDKKIRRFFNRTGSKNLKSIRIKTVQKLNNIIKSEELEKYILTDVIWDEIKSIIFKENQECYDLSIKNNHNYVANGIVCHNSWWQWALSYMAMFCGSRVIFYSLEMTENQIKRRAWQSLVGQPKEDKEVNIPYFVEDENEKNKWRIEIKKVFKKGVNVEEIKQRQDKLRIMSRGGEVLIKIIPAGSVTIEDIIIDMDNVYYYEKFIPDIVIIDYADILSPSKIVIRKELRHQLDHTWRTMRGLAQDRNILIVTASQTNRAGYSKDASMELLAEDDRKAAHASKIIGINKNKKDNSHNMIRIEQLAEREGNLNSRQVGVLHCLDIGKPYLESRYIEDVLGL